MALLINNSIRHTAIILYITYTRILLNEFIVYVSITCRTLGNLFIKNMVKQMEYRYGITKYDKRT